MNNGTQAMDRDRAQRLEAWIENLREECRIPSRGTDDRQRAATPTPKPAATRASVASVLRCSSPVRARSAKVAMMTDGGGTSRPLKFQSHPYEMISHEIAKMSGNTTPIAGRVRRVHRLVGSGALRSPFGDDKGHGVSRKRCAETDRFSPRGRAKFQFVIIK